MSLKNIICCTLILAWSCCQVDSSLAEEPPAHRCFDDMVYVGTPDARSGCYPKVGLDLECEFSLQCSSQTANSYCGFNAAPETFDRNSKVCLCDEGYTNSDPNNRLSCQPIRNCSNLSFNVNQEQSDCGDWQFCRYGVCHCKPDLSFDQATKQCVPVDGVDSGSCPDGQIYIRGPPVKKGCYPKVGLTEECHFTRQCNETTNAFCSWSAANGKNPTCQCGDGYRPDPTLQRCTPIKQCSVDGLNVGLEQADCEQRQFCRNRLCICKPDYEFDVARGECVRLAEGGAFEDDEDDQENLPPPTKGTNWPFWITFIILLLFCALASVYAIFLYRFRKDEAEEEKRDMENDDGDDSLRDPKKIVCQMDLRPVLNREKYTKVMTSDEDRDMEVEKEDRDMENEDCDDSLYDPKKFVCQMDLRLVPKREEYAKVMTDEATGPSEGTTKAETRLTDRETELRLLKESDL